LSRLRVLVAQAVTSQRLLGLRRQWHRRCGDADLHYFHEAGDPYSLLTASLLPRLREHYAVQLHEHAVPPPPARLAPDRERLFDWAWRDAENWRRLTGCLPEPLVAPAPGDRLPPAPTPAEQAGEQLRAAKGGFLGASFWFRGEWFWGLDRLPLLLRQLEDAGLARAEGWRNFPQRPRAADTPVSCAPQASPPDHNTAPPVLEFWCSLRSPYTYLAVPRVRAWAAAGLAEIRLRPLLPMVMRGLPVPWVKRRYILRDAKREALDLGLPFGRIADPVGRPTERGLAVLHHVATTRGTLAALAFLDSFLRGVFAEGIDAGSARGLQRIAERSGVDPAEIPLALRDDTWRDRVAEHRQALLDAGLWGVPSFRVAGYPAQWGQDRIWMVERQLRGIE